MCCGMTCYLPDAFKFKFHFHNKSLPTKARVFIADAPQIYHSFIPLSEDLSCQVVCRFISQYLLLSTHTKPCFLHSEAIK